MPAKAGIQGQGTGPRFRGDERFRSNAKAQGTSFACSRGENHERLSMRRSLILGFAILLTAGASALAESYPSKPIRAIIPFGAGSAADVIPRIVFDELSARLGQAIIVENRGGAGGIIGTATA